MSGFSALGLRCIARQSVRSASVSGTGIDETSCAQADVQNESPYS